MKGPGLRTRLDVRRLWECPETGKTCLTDGSVTQVRSPFTRTVCFMKFIEVVKTPRRQNSLAEILEHMNIEPAPPEIETPAESETQTQTANSNDEQRNATSQDADNSTATQTASNSLDEPVPPAPPEFDGDLSDLDSRQPPQGHQDKE